MMMPQKRKNRSDPQAVHRLRGVMVVTVTRIAADGARYKRLTGREFPTPSGSQPAWPIANSVAEAPRPCGCCQAATDENGHYLSIAVVGQETCHFRLNQTSHSSISCTIFYTHIVQGFTESSCVRKAFFFNSKLTNNASLTITSLLSTYV